MDIAFFRSSLMAMSYDWVADRSTREVWDFVSDYYWMDFRVTGIHRLVVNSASRSVGS